MKKRKAIFPGTFDPFTIGHYSIVKRSLTFADEIVIAIGINDAKTSYFTLEQRIEMIQDLYLHESNISVAAYDGLTANFAEQCEANFIVRGIRTVNDFEYEKTIADMNRVLIGIETIILFTEPELTHISSTIVRDLLKHDYDIGRFIPAGMTIPELNK